MPTLPELQSDFLRAVLDGAQVEAAGHVETKGLAPALRLGIYANNAAANFLESLRLSFPAIRRLVGDDYFDQCVRAYRELHPSRSGDLQHAGAAFPGYLAELHGADDYRYLGDVARLEWLCQESLLAGDHAPLDLTRLAAVPPEDYDGLRFELHPAARLFVSGFPAHAIWQANVGSAAEPEAIDLGRGADRLLITRTHGHIAFHPLSEGEAAFLEHLRRGETVAAAIAAGARDAEFDATQALPRFVRVEAIVDF